jgi:hypothetical protein
MPEQLNITNLPSSRVEFIDPRTGLMSREWYRFFLNLFNLTGGGNNQTSLDDLQLSPPSFPSTGGSGTVTFVDMTVPTGLEVSGNPITTSGTFVVTYASGYSIPTDASQAEWNTAYTERLQWDGGDTNLVAATGRTSLGATTIGSSMFTLTDPSAITFPQFNADNTVSALDAASFRTAIGAGIGSVTSVGLSLPSIFTVSGSPVTTTGTLTGDLASQTANYFFAAPDGSVGAPTFRAIVAADVPTLNQNTTGTASNVTGIVAVANGGTGTATPSLVAGTNVSITGSWPNQTINSSNPGGTVTSVDATVPSFLSISGGPITSSGTLAISYSGTALPILNGGTGQTTAGAAFNALSPITTTGDLIIGNGANSATRLPIGANTYVLTSNGTTAVWAVASGSGATITNDTATATNVYPLFAAATSGSLATAYTSNANYLYKPSTGELTSVAMVSSNGIQVNSKTVATSYTIATGNNGLSAGPVTVNSGISVTVSSGSTWVVV